MSEILNPEYESVRTTIEAGKKQADVAYKNNLMAAKQPAIAALQQGRITLEQYAELVGEPFSCTMAEEFRRKVEGAADAIKVRVESGLLSQEEYEAIVGGDVK